MSFTLREIERAVEMAYDVRNGDGWIATDGEIENAAGLEVCQRPGVDEGQWEFIQPLLVNAPEYLLFLVSEVRRLEGEKDALVTCIEDALNVAENVNTPFDPKLSPWCDMIAVIQQVTGDANGDPGSDCVVCVYDALACPVHAPPSSEDRPHG